MITYRIYYILRTTIAGYFMYLIQVIVTSSKNIYNRAYQHICVLEIVPPVGADLALTSYVPNIQLEAGRLNALYIEALFKDNMHA